MYTLLNILLYAIIHTIMYTLLKYKKTITKEAVKSSVAARSGPERLEEAYPA